MLVTKDERRGPWVFRAAGVGDPARAVAQSAERIVAGIDVDLLFGK